MVKNFNHKLHNAVRNLIGVFALLVALSGQVFAADNQDVKSAMQSLKEATAQLGAAKLDGDVLSFGSAKINGDFTVVDAIKAKHRPMPPSVKESPSTG